MLTPEVVPDKLSRQVFGMCFLKVLLLLAISFGFPSRGQSCCDEGWMQFGGNCYFFNHDSNGQDDWNDAKSACQLLGGHLVDIRSEDEWQFVKSRLQPGGNIYAQYMIGMSDAAREGHWKYADGTDVTFFKWGTGQPSGGRIENCGCLFSDTQIGRYNDGPCTYKYGRYICKKGVAL